MLTSRFVRFGLAAASLVAVVAAPVFAAVSRPIRGQANIAIVDAQPQPSGDVRLTATGTGFATQLGPFTRTETALLHPNGTLDGSLVFTTLGGAELRVNFTGAFTSQTTAEGTYTFAGGTEQFAGANGTAAFSASTTDGVHFTVTFAGTLRN
jgi:hypothetical protein